MDYYAKGLIVGIGVAMIFFMALKLFRRKSLSEEAQYDERQRIARGVAFKYAYWTLLLYIALYAVVDLSGFRFCETFTGIIIGVTLSLGVFACTAIMKDAYVGINQNKRWWVILNIIVILANAFATVPNFLEGNIIENGMLSHGVVNILMVILFSAVLITYAVHNRSIKTDEEDE
ncbi:MAG: hypothetical protein IJR47_00800 [Clostridia bacterium]|nr:hypothetical protein [Clostridia bacterium]